MQGCIVALLGLSLSVTAATWSHGADARALVMRVSVLDDLGGRVPKAKDADPRKFFDASFVRQMQSSGFIDALYRSP
jgi:hypothetical protein